MRCIAAIDVGGTSADVCLPEQGEATLTVEGELADLPLNFPMLDVHSIGAGGGSIARVSSNGGLQVDIVNLRVSARGPARPFTTPRPLAHGHRTPVEPTDTRQVYFPVRGGFVDCPVYAYTDIMPGFQLTGPAIMTQNLTTLVIEPDHHARMDAYGNIVMSIPNPHAS